MFLAPGGKIPPGVFSVKNGKYKLLSVSENSYEKLADKVIITSDNPRGENPQDIIRDILSGIGSKRNVTVEADRKKAIALALKKAKKGDTVLIAGKGHEEYQLIGSEKYYFSDELTVRELCGLV